MSTLGIVGLGHLGEIHLKNWLSILPKENIYIYDVSSERTSLLSSQYEVKSVVSYDQLLEVANMIDIVTPTDSHFQLAVKAMELSKDVFIEKPICETLEQFDELERLQRIYGNIIQIGFVERFNPAFLLVKDQIQKPKFFEIHRLAPYNPRGTEVSVVMDLMIHDLDILTYFVDSPLKNLSATGVSVLSQSHDIVNARLEFEDGCVANMTASRISMKKMRKMRVFCDNKYANIDFLEKNSELYEIENEDIQGEGLRFTTHDGEKKMLKYSKFHNSDPSLTNSILDELSFFYLKSKNKNIKDVENILPCKRSLEYAGLVQKKIQ